MSGSRHTAGTEPFAAVAVVGSQGALPALREILSSLPADFPAAVIVDLHRRDPAELTGLLLARRSGLALGCPAPGLAIQPATIYLAPEDRTMTVTAAPAPALAVSPPDDRLWHCRADDLLASAAREYGRRLISVVLSGRLHGGAAGVREVKRCGGRVLVQAPASATAPSMPTAALATGCADFALPPTTLAHALLALCAVPGADELFRVRLNVGVRG